MRLSSFAFSLTLIVVSQAVLGCQGVRKFFLGDPDQVKPPREALPAAVDTPEGFGASGALPSVPSAPTPLAVPSIRLPDGTLASDEYARASDLRAHGQLWMAHIVLAPKALSSTGTDPEKRLLLDICKEQGDQVCVAQAEGSLAGGAKHVETDLERAEALAATNPKKARLLLDSKLRNGTASMEELKFLQTLCTKLRDTGCVRKVAVAMAKMAQ